MAGLQVRELLVSPMRQSEQVDGEDRNTSLRHLLHHLAHLRHVRLHHHHLRHHFLLSGLEETAKARLHHSGLEAGLEAGLKAAYCHISERSSSELRF